MRINLERLRNDVQRLAEIGHDPESHGLYRMAFTDADMEGKRWYTERLMETGVEVEWDGAANVWGKLEGEAPGAASVVIGSHLDTVPCAGTLDGSLGVLVGLECLRVLCENGIKFHRAIELVAFSDEEGRFGAMLGSEAVCGRVTPERLHFKDLEGISVSQAMEKHGLDPWKVLEAARNPESIHRYLELHIEQGPVLDREGASVGIVDEITGLFKWSVKLRGESNHAGTTPMSMRRDAFMGLADFAHEIPRLIDENGTERSRVTIGRVRIVPGAANTVPGLVEFALDVRDTSSAVLDELADACRKALFAISRRRDLMFEFEVLSRIEPVPCDSAMVEVLTSKAKALGLRSLRLPSGAAHDAQIMASIAPVGMIFVPSRGGISHAPGEWTAWSDIEAGANLTLQSLAEIASQRDA